MFTANYNYNLNLAKTSIAFQQDQECLTDFARIQERPVLQFEGAPDGQFCPHQSGPET